MGEHAAALDDMAAQLAAELQVQGNKGWSEWSQLHGKLAQVAAGAGGDNPRKAVQDLLDVAKDASSSQALMRALEERVSKANLKYLVYHVARELSMTPLGDSEPVHMIDEKDKFCQQNVDNIIKRSAELSVPNTPYAVVSIIGAQSSGKSYLLNRLFGTKFQVMDGNLKRKQTTRGIVISTCIGPSLLLLDVEGFNGRERGEDTTFEKQAALFALTVSDLMMVNMTVLDVGLQQGGATELFRTLFEERAKLAPGLTKILVVLRDYYGEPSIDILSSDVMTSLEEIWEKVNMESVKFKDYIEVNIIALPHKISVDFPKEVTILRKMLSNIGSAKVPASGFSLSSSRFWDTIKENKKLDIPSHQVALAKNYCRDLVERLTLNSINYQEKYKLLKAEESTVRFREISHELVEKIKTEYDLETKQYDTDVRDNERRNLVEKLHENINGIAIELANKLLNDTLEQFIREFSVKNIKDMKEASNGLYKYAEQFVSSCEDLKVYDSDQLSKIRRDLEERLASCADKRIEYKNHIAIERAKKVLEDTAKQFEREFPKENIKDMKQASDGLYKYVEQFTSSCEDLKVFHSDLLRKMCTDLQEGLASFAEQNIKNKNGIAIKLADKVLEDTVEQFKREFPEKNIKDMKEASDGLYKYVEEFTRSCEDLKVFHSDHLSKKCTDLQKRLASFAEQKIKKEGDRKSEQRKKVVGHVWTGIKTAGSIALCAMAADAAGVIEGVSSLVDALHDDEDSHICSMIGGILRDARPRILDSDLGGAMDHASDLVAAAQAGQDSDILSPIIHDIGHDLLPHILDDETKVDVSSLIDAAHDDQNSDISSIIREIRQDLLPHNIFDADLAGAWRHGQSQT